MYDIFGAPLAPESNSWESSGIGPSWAGEDVEIIVTGRRENTIYPDDIPPGQSIGEYLFGPGYGSEFSCDLSQQIGSSDQSDSDAGGRFYTTDHGTGSVQPDGSIEFPDGTVWSASEVAALYDNSARLNALLATMDQNTSIFAAEISMYDPDTGSFSIGVVRSHDGDYHVSIGGLSAFVDVGATPLEIRPGDDVAVITTNVETTVQSENLGVDVYLDFGFFKIKVRGN